MVSFFVNSRIDRKHREAGRELEAKVQKEVEFACVFLLLSFLDLSMHLGGFQNIAKA